LLAAGFGSLSRISQDVFLYYNYYNLKLIIGDRVTLFAGPKYYFGSASGDGADYIHPYWNFGIGYGFGR